MLKDDFCGLCVPERAAAYMVYDITVSGCGVLVADTDTAKACGKLILAPGTVSTGYACGIPAVDICIPPCFCGKMEPVTVALEKHSCGECIWTDTRCAAPPAAHVGDTVHYTVTFTNHSPVMLKDVRIFCTVPDGLTVIESSIRPVPLSGETLPTGITIGEVPAQSSVKLEFSAIVNQDASSRLIIRARAEYYYQDCAGCCRRGVGGECVCIVKVKPCVPKISIVKSADKKSVCRKCEEIIYTLTISNPGSAALRDVTVRDDIPDGLCYKPCSTSRNGGEHTDENPQYGIRIGKLSPGESYTVEFTALVRSIPKCHGVVPYKFCNTACVTGRYENTVVRAVSNEWVVRAEVRCLCEQVCKTLAIPGLVRLCDCYIYHTGVRQYNLGFGNTIAAGYGVTVKYIDNDGDKRSKDFEDTILFFLPDNADTDCLSIQYADLCCCHSRDGHISAEFKASLCYCASRP